MTPATLEETAVATFLNSATMLDVSDAIARRGVPFARDVEDQDDGCGDFGVRGPDGLTVGIGRALTKG